MQPESCVSITFIRDNPGSTGLSCCHSHCARFSLVGFSVRDVVQITVIERGHGSAEGPPHVGKIEHPAERRIEVAADGQFDLERMAVQARTGMRAGSAGRRRAQLQWKKRKMSHAAFSRKTLRMTMRQGHGMYARPDKLSGVTFSLPKSRMPVQRLFVATATALVLLSLNACSRDSGWSSAGHRMKGDRNAPIGLSAAPATAPAHMQHALREAGSPESTTSGKAWLAAPPGRAGLRGLPVEACKISETPREQRFSPGNSRLACRPSGPAGRARCHTNRIRSSPPVWVSVACGTASHA